MSTVTAPSRSVRNTSAPACPVAVQHLRHRVPEVVGPAGADDGDGRRQRADELRRARGQAAVVRHLHDPQRRGRNRRQQLAFDRPADVAGQHHRDVAPPQLEHDRVVVADLLPLPVRQLRMADDDLDAVDRASDRRACTIRPSAHRPPPPPAAAREAARTAAPGCLPRPPAAGTRARATRRRRCDRDRRGSARACRAAGRPAPAAPARPPGRRCRTSRAAPDPPLSTSSVAPRGKRTSAASPCPTSMNVTCRRPSPRAATNAHGSATIQNRRHRPPRRQRLDASASSSSRARRTPAAV